MRRYIIRRLLFRIPGLLITVAVASMLRLVPGDPGTLAPGTAATPKDRQVLRHAFHLDDSMPVQYARWWHDVVHGDLGRSVPGSWPGTLVRILPVIRRNDLPPIGKVPRFDNPLRNLQQYDLPAVVRAIGGAAGITRLERSTVIEVLRND